MKRQRSGLSSCICLCGLEVEHLPAFAVDGQGALAERDAPSVVEKREVGAFLFVDGLIGGGYQGVHDAAEGYLVASPHAVSAVAVDAAVAGNLVGSGVEVECNLCPFDYRPGIIRISV